MSVNIFPLDVFDFGVSLSGIILHEPCLVKVSTMDEGGGVSKIPKKCPRGSWIASLLLMCQSELGRQYYYGCIYVFINKEKENLISDKTKSWKRLMQVF